MNRTPNGFRMGAAEVVAVADIMGHAILWIQTAHTRREIRVTPAGRKIVVSAALPPVAFREGAQP